MGNKKKVIRGLLFFVYLCSFALIFTLVGHTSIETYIQTLKQTNSVVQINEDTMLKEIKMLAEQINESSIDARIDRVWHAIPGYNGLQVDQKKSLKVSKEVGHVSLKTLVIQETEPSIQLNDLPPHPIYRGNSKKPMISLMVNVAWGTEYVEQMLHIFDQYQIRVTFYLDGKWLKENAPLAKKMLASGHELGNHAYSHPDMRKLTVERIREEIEKTEKLIKEVGTKSRFFAPPSGSFDQRVVQIADQMDMKTILWTLDTVDWQKPSSSTIVERIVPHLENGALILMHPTQPTVEALPKIIEGAMEKELMPVTVSDLISPARTLSIERFE